MSDPLARIADALERIAEAQDAIAGETVEHNAYQEGYRDAVTDQAVSNPAWADAQPAAPDMSGALEAEYQRGRADGARQQREADKWNFWPMRARALGTHPLITDATSDQENYGDGPQ